MQTLHDSEVSTRQHFKLLDGLRGVAALAIVVFHFAEWIFDPSQNFIFHGFLAVDFFFCLSGFVVAYAYDNRIDDMGIWTFFKRRIIRLHPMVILGTLLGFIAFLSDPFSNAAATYSWGKTALIFLSSMLLIPLPIMEERSFNNFGLNAPAWSLFWEYVANIVYAVILYKFHRRVTGILLLISGLTLIYVAYTSGNVMGGWDGNTFWHGGARIAFSFLAGLTIYRNQWILRNNLGFVGLSILLLVALVMPYTSWNWLSELLIVGLFFPLLVSLGAGSSLSPKTEKICQLSGELSYPLYMTHYATIWMFSNYFITTKPSPTELTLVVVIGTILMTLFAYLVMKYYDIPIRRYLSQTWK